MLSRTLGRSLAQVLEMSSPEYELYKAEFLRCPWDPYFKQTQDEYQEAPDLSAFTE